MTAMTDEPNAPERVAPYLSDRFEWAAPGDQQEDVWLVRFCDKDCGEAIFTGPEAEREAWEHWNRYAPAFNIYVFRLAKLAANPHPAPPVQQDEGRAASLIAALNDPHKPKVGEGDYSYLPLDRLPHALREQAKDVLFFEAEPKVIIDAWNLVQMAADELAAALSTRPATSETGEVER